MHSGNAQTGQAVAVRRATSPSVPDDLSMLAAVLSAHRPIAYNVNVARITRDIKATLFLSQLIYWTRVGVDVERNAGWIFKTREQWSHETGLSRREQESARTHLLALGLIQEIRAGIPARNCYRVVPKNLGARLAELLRSEVVQWTLFDIRSKSSLLFDCKKKKKKV